MTEVPQPLVAVTGATGRLGGRVAHRLAEAGVRQRLVVRQPERAPVLPGCEIARAAYHDGAAVTEALTGVDTVFMVSGAESARRVAEHRTFIDAAVAAGVRRLVYTSFYGAAPDATFTLARDHWHTEEHLKASGLAWTVLRDNLYLDVLPLFADAEGVIRGPAGDGRVAAVAIDDIADVAATVLREPGRHDGQTYDLTGPQALTLAQVAEIVTLVTGRPMRYHAETPAEAYQSRTHYQAPDWQVEAWVSTYLAIGTGELAAPTDAVKRLTGVDPLTLEDLLRLG
ncbi:NAD(P)-dependent oxidoreductase [Catellatospora sp. TT07R-123]|uniref:SDR family oxidoreductase n=1 Tax=Catellatospora sp. TT07R-123 TaxID=2733863 RepID=UPI001B16FB35|nr:SDR family oxidoreductase [Catellatospora sp. TT07R-123]GHJ48733.1 NAD(P)-dependent oxidoreductase [Catellatospora sp. TT07R-123]